MDLTKLEINMETLEESANIAGMILAAFGIIGGVWTMAEKLHNLRKQLIPLGKGQTSLLCYHAEG
jgi:hypothetical protein